MKEDIINKIKADSDDYTAYYEWGSELESSNANQAYLCFEQAKWLCRDDAVKNDIERKMGECKKAEGFYVHPASIIILSYNSKDIMIGCLESIRKGCAEGSFEIVIVDNNSQDGIREYLEAQRDIVFHANDHNTSFAGGCNQCVKLASPDNDIFLLNNDTVMPKFALFYLRMALYSDENIGAAGPMANMVVSSQIISECCNKGPEECMEYAKSVHIPGENVLENRTWLSGFALLIKRKVWDKIGCLDERFIRGGYEDTEYGFRVCKEGYRNVIVHNAFIFHYGSVSFKKDMAAFNKALADNQKKLDDLLELDHKYFSGCRNEMCGMVKELGIENVSVLEIGCGFGQTLSKLQYLCPDAKVTGIEKDEKAAKIGCNISNVICADAEYGLLPFEEGEFDVLLLPDVVGYFDNAHDTLVKLKKYVKKGGTVIFSIPNIFHVSNLVSMLEGKFDSIEKIDAGCRHYYTMDEVMKLFGEAGYLVKSLLLMTSGNVNLSVAEQRMVDALKAIPEVKALNNMTTENFVFTAKL